MAGVIAQRVKRAFARDVRAARATSAPTPPILKSSASAPMFTTTDASRGSNNESSRVALARNEISRIQVCPPT
jgi:hypothetical protein